MPVVFSHVFAFPFEIYSKKDDASDLNLDQLKECLLENIYKLSPDDLKTCIQRYNTAALGSDEFTEREIDRDHLNHEFPITSWFKAIDKGETQSGLLEWQLKKDREQKLLPELERV